ncbi:acyl carrier protein [Chryseobacterium sp.]|uniref:acyl carrier protein n=1 Tax=Chryseobacterium sp. TaxID=1871047 RepID=UPI00289F1811|nr:acyl carrier protein [Chryseobacterium sp.]
MQDINKLVEIVKEQFTNASEIVLTAETNFKQIDSFDSLTGMCIIVAIKDEFDKEINEEQFRSITTVEELYHLVTK